MCIQWCCKHCPKKLTHRWAYEHCNEYFDTRSHHKDLAECPSGPELLRHAYHRHPYRGPQTCDRCRTLIRRDQKVAQLAKQRDNRAQGLRADWNGAKDLGEIYKPSQLPLEHGQLDAMKARWESFTATHRHLPSHELEREWARRFTASNLADIKTGVLPSRSENATIVGQRASPKHGDRFNTAVAGEVSGTPLQNIYPQSILSTREANGSLPQTAPPLIYHSNNSKIERVSNTLEALSSAKQLILSKQNIHPTASTDDQIPAPFKVALTRSADTQQQPLYKIRWEPTKDINSYTNIQHKSSRNTEYSTVNSNSIPTTLPSSSRSVPTRPWDL